MEKIKQCKSKQTGFIAGGNWRNKMNGKKMGIKGKLLLLIGGALVAFIALAGYSGKTATDLRGQIELLGNSRIPISEAIGDVRAGSNGAPRFMWVSLANLPGSPERTQSLEKVTFFGTN